MRLAKYLEDHKISAAAFARQIGVKSRMTVSRYCLGQRMPPRDTMQKIVTATSGAVTPNDFFADAAE